MTRTARLALAAGVLLTVVVGPATPALAHGSGIDARNYRSTVTDAPPIEGVQWRVYGGDELLWVENLTDEELLVYGYDRDPPDPYLRIGPHGVFENQNSEATRHNRERLGSPTPDSADPADPDWVQVSTQPRFLWHDHRIHHTGEEPHPRVADPGERTPIMGWEVPFALAGEELVVEGELEWVPGPSPWPWLAVGLALTLPALAGLRTQPIGGRWPGLVRPAAAVLGVAAAANVTFLLDDLLAVPLPVLTAVFAALQTAVFLGIAAFGAVRAWQAGDGAFTALGVGAGALLVGPGLLSWPVLTASQVSTVFPEMLPRLVVGANVMQALPLGIVAVVGTRRLLPDRSETAASDESAAPAG